MLSSRVIAYSLAGDVDRMQVQFWAKAWQAIGGQSANTQAALRYLLRQGEELAKNPDLNPAYVRWLASADSGAVQNVDSQHDGWWNIERFQPDYTRLVSGLVPVRLTVSKVTAGAPATQAVIYRGGALSTNYSGGAQTAIGYPLASTNQAATPVTRTGGEGAVPLSISPQASFNPLFFTPSATKGDWFKGGCHVYDTLA